MSIVICDNAAAVADSLAQYVAKCAAEAVAANGKFTIALSGGSLPNVLAEGLLKPQYAESIDWKAWHVFFADERVVPLTHDDSNYKACRVLFDKVAIPSDQIYTINYCEDIQSCALDYEAKLKSAFGDTSAFPRFDLVLLGIGPDGHTCSLFPGHKLLNEHTQWVASISDSPKPPPQRITLTFPVLSAAAHVAFVGTGDGKAAVLANIHNEHNSKQYPAGMVTVTNGELVWLLDQSAASQLAR